MLGGRLDARLIAEVKARAGLSPRRRSNHCFHQPHDRVQRMLNIAYADSYFAPHRHRNPDKLEIFTVLEGEVFILAFSEDGKIADRCRLTAPTQLSGSADALADSRARKVAVTPADSPAAGSESARQVEIPPGVWHSLVVVSPVAVLYEVIDGHYDPSSHKEFAPWAPQERDAEAARAYLADLRTALGLPTA